MVRRLMVLLCVGLAASAGWTQTRFARIPLEVPPSFSTSYQPAEILLPWTDYAPFVSVTLEVIGWTGAQMEACQWRLSGKNRHGIWQEAVELHPDPHAGDGAGRHFTRLVELDTGMTALRLEVLNPLVMSGSTMPSRWNLHVFDPGRTPSRPSGDERTGGLREEPCACAAPSITDRATWCPDGTCFPHPDPEYTIPTHLIIHHSAGTNVSSDWAAVVRSIWSFHVNSNGWSDIGYNWLIDPHGRIYEGRGDGIVGAHFCGKNSETLGTCVLGDFTVATPQPAALASLNALYAWKACTGSIHPEGTSWHTPSLGPLPHVAGHRDGCQTSCPGNAFYPMLHMVRQGILKYLQDSCACLVDPPLSVQAIFQSDGVVIAWSEVPGQDIRYTVERKGPADADYLPLAVVEATGFFDADPGEAGSYAYRVRAGNMWCWSDASQPANVMVYPRTRVEAMPNPAQEELRIRMSNSLPGPVDVRLFSVEGRLVRQWEFSKPGFDWEARIDVRPLAAGHYLMQVRWAGERHLFRIAVHP